MKYTDEQVKIFLEKNNDEWQQLIEKRYVRRDVFEKIRDLKLKGHNPSIEVSEKELLKNPLRAFLVSLTKQRNLWNKINHSTESDEEREMSLIISDRYDSILKTLRNQLNLGKFIKQEKSEVNNG